MDCLFLVKTARFDAIVASSNSMVEDILSQDKKSHKKVERKVQFSLHDAPIVYLPELDIERQDVWVYLSVCSQHPTSIQARDKEKNGKESMRKFVEDNPKSIDPCGTLLDECSVGDIARKKVQKGKRNKNWYAWTKKNTHEKYHNEG